MCDCYLLDAIRNQKQMEHSQQIYFLATKPSKTKALKKKKIKYMQGFRKSVSYFFLILGCFFSFTNGTTISTEDAAVDSCLHPSNVSEPLPGAGIASLLSDHVRYNLDLANLLRMYFAPT